MFVCEVSCSVFFLFCSVFSSLGLSVVISGLYSCLCLPTFCLSVSVDVILFVVFVKSFSFIFFVVSVDFLPCLISFFVTLLRKGTPCLSVLLLVCWVLWGSVTCMVFLCVGFE